MQIDAYRISLPFPLCTIYTYQSDKRLLEFTHTLHALCAQILHSHNKMSIKCAFKHKSFRNFRVFSLSVFLVIFFVIFFCGFHSRFIVCHYLFCYGEQMMFVFRFHASFTFCRNAARLCEAVLPFLFNKPLKIIDQRNHFKIAFNHKFTE